MDSLDGFLAFCRHRHVPYKVQIDNPHASYFLPAGESTWAGVTNMAEVEIHDPSPSPRLRGHMR